LQGLVKISRLIDRLNLGVGRLVYWLILAAVLISSVNATMRYLFSVSSNAWLEVQWYLYSAVFLLCAGYTLLLNEHVRIDIIVGRYSKRTQAWIDVFGVIVFLLPMAVVIGWLSWPMFVKAFVSQEMSGDAGGLIRWPVILLMPVGFALLTLQGLSELIKRLAFLAGVIPEPTREKELKGGDKAEVAQ
jgi:TRAP-type mannitol/chloroaromatic compound transport system permease small subunit